MISYSNFLIKTSVFITSSHGNNKLVFESDFKYKNYTNSRKQFILNKIFFIYKDEVNSVNLRLFYLINPIRDE